MCGCHSWNQVEIQVELEELGAGQEQVEMFDLDPSDTIVGQEQSNDPADEEGGASEDGGDDFSVIYLRRWVVWIATMHRPCIPTRPRLHNRDG